MSLNVVFIGGDEERCFVVLMAISDVTAGDSRRKTPAVLNHEHVVLLLVFFTRHFSCCCSAADFIVNFKISYTIRANILPDHMKNSNWQVNYFKFLLYLFLISAF